MHFTLKKLTTFINFVRAFNIKLVANKNLFPTKPSNVNLVKIGLDTFILLVVCRCMFFFVLRKGFNDQKIQASPQQGTEV